ncbi:MAG: putative tRNA threonylcarbamoyladenosine biosynthesis protein Gcp [Candidatus Saccharibacteria bacterium GW2011_GWA2_46_10]|nr:MAG: putative tRNA threonylcarbamoyladenosine biosynthesis protein Gcp [Candidatus Saccharibacteria bacterium GW2011_GWA2_46_10]OGL36044.1 MAG: hypothetical protein A3F05_00995 [Candidatus Saccharibacteria bacterium RIFCSPHIGHO2_12_FULL_47_17]
MRILGIESSCDETAAAVVEDGRKLLSNVISSSIDLHKAYGGVVPEIAARSHIESILPVIEKALVDAFGAKSQKPKAQSPNKNLSAFSFQLSAGFDPWDQIDAIAVTQGPGLIGSLLIGVLTARTLAIVKNKPLYAVNHVAAHPYALFLTKTSPALSTVYHLPSTAPEFPILALTVSGGHTQLILMKDAKSQKLLGQSGDDAAGEAYDKVAKMLGLPYPGGPELAKLAKKGNSKTFDLPKAKLESPYDFSFSGLKTAVLRTAQKLTGNDYTFPSSKLPKVLDEAQKADIAASFQRTVNETLVETLNKAEVKFQPKTIIISGGVAANEDLRQQASSITKSIGLHPMHIYYPDIKLCTDNAAMIAASAFYQKLSADPYTLEPNPSLSI